MTELEDAATDTERIKSVPQPLVQESAHPYTDDAVQTGHVRIAGAEGLRVEFDRQVGRTKNVFPKFISKLPPRSRTGRTD